MTSWRQERHRQHKRAYYELNKELVKAKAKAHDKRQALRLAEVIDREKSRPCAVCERSLPPHLMQFDHIEPSHKRFNIADVRHSGYSVDTVLKEIAKCRVLCVECHTDHTAKQRAARVTFDRLPEPASPQLPLFASDKP